MAFSFLIIQFVSSCLTWEEMTILACWQENAIHDNCVFIQLLHAAAVYIWEALLKCTYIDIVPQMHLEILLIEVKLTNVYYW